MNTDFEDRILDLGRTLDRDKGDILTGEEIDQAWSRQMGKNLSPQEIWYDFPIRPGFYLQNGAVALPGGVSFTVHSEGATAIDLVLFKKNQEKPFAIIPFPDKYRVGDVYSMIVFGLDILDLEYCFRLDGDYNPGRGLYFDRTKGVVDPYCRKIIMRENREEAYPYRGQVTVDTYDWGTTVAPRLEQDEMIIYELHVKGFTAHPSSGVKAPGTFRGLIEKIPYLKELGVNVVELMPIFSFDPTVDTRVHDGNTLQDYWGYNPAGFFSYHLPYCAEDIRHEEGQELKDLVKALHDNGMEIILDVVFNHTGEGSEKGPYINFRGFDNNIYYMLTPGGKFFNFSGCGNTLNANHPIVRQLILECLRYWVSSYHIDGFRFDLASILGRYEDGSPMSDPPLLQSLAYDPILKKVELIAEAWDAGGLYQVGSFPSWSRWGEWNGRYRDDLRCFLKGDAGMAPWAAKRITGSRDLYPPEKRGKHASVNFITCHDGFTLRDLYSYNEKHNLANGWNNTDGENFNNSWNCGVEGETDDPEIKALRTRMALNACVVLLSSVGIPMLLSGDEFGNTQNGNNNPYCQDNEISWLDWSLLDENQDFFHFWQKMIRFRKHHPILRGSGQKPALELPEVSYHSARAWDFDDEKQEGHYVGVMFAGRDESGLEDEVIYLAVNAGWEGVHVDLPLMPHKEDWRLVVNTSQDFPYNFHEDMDDAPIVERDLYVPERSVFLLVSKPLPSWEEAEAMKEKDRLEWAKRQAGDLYPYHFHLKDEISSGSYSVWKRDLEE